jgi:hypothetical protein
MQSSLLQSDLAAKRTSSTAATSAASSLVTATATPTTSGSSNALGSAAISSFAQFLGKLQNLAQTNPTKEKSVLSDIANKLQTQAQSAGGDTGQRLSQMADRFAQAAQTGDLSGLQAKAAAGGSGATSRKLSAYQQNSGVDQSVLDVLNGESL